MPWGDRVDDLPVGEHFAVHVEVRRQIGWCFRRVGIDDERQPCRVKLGQVRRREHPRVRGDDHAPPRSRLRAHLPRLRQRRTLPGFSDPNTPPGATEHQVKRSYARLRREGVPSQVASRAITSSVADRRRDAVRPRRRGYSTPSPLVHSPSTIPSSAAGWRQARWIRRRSDCGSGGEPQCFSNILLGQPPGSSDLVTRQLARP